MAKDAPETLDHSAIQELLRKRVHWLRALIAENIPARHRPTLDVDDVLQDVYVAAFRGAPDFRHYGRTTFDRWLRAVAESRLVDRLKALRRAKRGGDGQTLRTERRLSYAALADRLYSPGRTPSSEVARAEAIDAVQIAVAGLPERYREVVHLRYIEGLSQAEVAERVGCSRANVHRMILLGLQRLRADMGDASDYMSR